MSISAKKNKRKGNDTVVLHQHLYHCLAFYQAGLSKILFLQYQIRPFRQIHSILLCYFTKIHTTQWDHLMVINRIIIQISFVCILSCISTISTIFLGASNDFRSRNIMPSFHTTLRYSCCIYLWIFCTNKKQSNKETCMMSPTNKIDFILYRQNGFKD